MKKDDTSIQQAQIIKEIMTEITNEGLKVSYIEISKRTGIELLAVRNRINDPNFSELRKMYDDLKN